MGRKIDWDFYKVPTQSESLRGGCLDGVVKVISLGYLGIETTITSPEILFRPSSSPEIPGVKTVEAAEWSLNHDVILNPTDFDDFNSPEITRRIVRKKPEDL
ncbi:hypothetical protein A2774_00495 [Candidatus Roizmanbacteria bacterium RIFCSPHIGHO2_01_FULL_39_12c]|uniref:Uncharacterized protein n=1 Tax=Candidatus Roizmanbacteria bacterium RIFCSPHIGHO2_01_FULL_39_12c TaxID=1802031 RepID=A0A1F7G9Y1_9BACT|nr:MAG: hypothetical protein A2774_00495 [Candidatus Roizmanbacteria bacterium RIFCSPHIGHO2_01_FULL_39_12c]OGK46218.1 MAG: hypothetical protein A2963_02005 [Candidatus Roizmanbacteria bacterium RIFCSPLOWO2_01_FULL_40_13]